MWPATIAAIIVALDRITKIWIERKVSLTESITVIPGFFDIVHTKNRGVAFGIFDDSESALRTTALIVVSVAVLIFVIGVLMRPHKAGLRTSRLTTVALACVIGGAFGNLWDRTMSGMVTDFLEFYWRDYRFAAFNVADSAITVGALLLIFEMWQTREEPVKA